MDINAYVLSKKYTDDSMEGAGAVAGKPCQIQSITDITGGHRVIFLWVDNAGTSHTSVMDVKDGTNAVQISDIVATNDNKIKVIMADGTEYVTTEIPTIQGEEGKSAYEVAVEQGYVGTEEEWLASLKGDKGDAGEGVPTGGTTGQVLVKKSSTDYDTEWGTPAGGGDMLKSVYDTDNDGKVDSAENADTVGGHTVAKDVPADAVFTDTVYDDTEIRGDIADKVDKVTGKGLSTNDYSDADKAIVDGVTSALEGKADVADIPSKTSDLTNDSGFITKAVNDLVNYYLKSETYSKTEVDDIVTAIKNSRFEVVATLPTTDIKTNVIYLVPKSPSQTSNVKDEYINLDGTTAGWEKIGDTEIDLSDYVTTQALNTALAAYTTTDDLTTLLAGKQDTLTFDNAPTENSNNPVKSNGLYVANRNIYEAMSEMGAKNLFRIMNASQVINGIEWVVNDDGTITANGTATEESKFTAQSKSAATHYYDENMMKAIAGKTIRYSGCPSGGSSSTYLFRLYIANAGGSTDEYGEGAERAIVSDFLERNFSVECIIKSGQTVTNLTYKPMICLASDTDTTYQPYSKTNKQITDDIASAVANVPNGAINLAKPVSARTTTINDVEFVIDSEGKVTANGTASANIRFDMAEVTLKAGRTYQLYEPSSLQARRPLNPESCRCYARIKSSGVWVLQNNGWRDSYTPSSDVVVSVGIAMQSGNEVTDEIFAPMLVLDGTDVGDTFYPYAMTNRELTEKIDIVGNLFTTTTKVVDNITHGIATTVATLKNLPIGTYVVSGQFNSDSAMSGGGLVQFASSGVIQNGASCSTIINQGFKANAGLTGIFNVTNATNQINLQIYTANADLTVSSARLAAIRIA